MLRYQRIVLWIFTCMLTSGCSPLFHQTRLPQTYSDHVTGIVVKQGRSAPIIDGIGWVAGAPTKLALWDRRADNHSVSPETVGTLLRYMNANELNDVVVNVNRYDPWGEWERLTSNNRISPGWKYSAGLYAVLTRITLLFSMPILELDLYRYLWDGAVVTQGASPYEFSPQQGKRPS